MIKCECKNRYGTEITSLQMFEEINNYLLDCKHRNEYKEIIFKKPYCSFGLFDKRYASKWYKCKCCGTLWEINYPDEKGGAWIRKFSDGKYRLLERHKYNY